MKYFDAFMDFLKALFNALTQFLGRSIPVISDFDGIEPAESETAAG